MLTPSQVIPFLEHENDKVRAHAARYLAFAQDPTPATADDFWRAIDKFGLTEWSLTANLCLLPQTEQSYARLTAALRALDEPKSEDDEAVADHLWTVLEFLDQDLLLKHRDEVLGFDKAPARVRRALEQRLSLQNVPLDELWDRLLKRSEMLEGQYEDEDDEEDEDESEDEEGDEGDEDDDEGDQDAEFDEDEGDDAEEGGDEDEDEDDEEDEDVDEDYEEEDYEEEDYEEVPPRPISHHLIEALARDFPREAAARAMDRLTNGPRDDWMEIYCVKLVGETKHREAVPLLLKRLLDDDGELMDAIEEALVQLGDASVVRQIEAFYPGKSTDVRFTLHEPLGRIKLPETEASVARLLREKVRNRWYRPQGTELELFTGLADVLLDLCPSAESLELVRQIVIDRRYNPHVEALDEELLLVGSMVGYEPPEAEAWRKAIADRDAARASETARWKEMSKQPDGTAKLLASFLDRIAGRSGPTAESPPQPDSLEPLASPEPLEPPGPLTPIHRNTAKVGRNDPCPCGSGKKYKKCCMDKDNAG